MEMNRSCAPRVGTATINHWNHNSEHVVARHTGTYFLQRLPRWIISSSVHIHALLHDLEHSERCPKRHNLQQNVKNILMFLHKILHCAWNCINRHSKLHYDCDTMKPRNFFCILTYLSLDLLLAKKSRYNDWSLLSQWCLNTVTFIYQRNASLLTNSFSI